MKIAAKSFAKVNPYLKVKGKRRDGYHQLDISYLSVNLGDKMRFSQSAREEIEVITDANLPPEENLCYKVAVKLQKKCGVQSGAKINLEKRIPIGGGLGGGSSNAATTLICLNRLWSCNLSRRGLIDIGKEFGADIPFFFYGGYCTGTGKGTNLQQKENVFQDRTIPLVCPSFSQLTSEVYAKYDQICDESDLKEIDVNGYPLENPASLTIENDLQHPAIRLNPELSSYLSLFQEANTIVSSGLAGSGSCVFGISRASVTPEQIRQEIEESLNRISEEARLEIARPTNTGQLVQQVE